MIHEWKMRKVIPNRNECVEKFPKVLKYIAGRKNETSVVKVFFIDEDKDAEGYFKEKSLIDESEFEFVNLKDKLWNSKRLETDEVQLPSPMDKTTRQRLDDIINDRGMKLFANYSNITWISVGYKSKGTNNGKPCIVLHCLDETLVPFGEKNLPENLDGYPVDVRESFVKLANCKTCECLKHGCCIGIPGITGSLGIFVKMNRPLNSPLNGFLTAAHVALTRHTDLFESSSLLSADHDLKDGTYHINHVTTTPQIIGTVREAIFGNLNSVGIDAAFVEIHDITHGKIVRCVSVGGWVCEYVCFGTFSRPCKIMLYILI